MLWRCPTAETLNLSRPVVTIIIQNREKSLKTRVLNRTARDFPVTVRREANNAISCSAHRSYPSRT